MSRRHTSLSNAAAVDVTREIDSRYDNVKIVADNIDAINMLADLTIPDIETLVEGGIKGLTPEITFSIDAQGNLVYDVSYTDQIDFAVEEW